MVQKAKLEKVAEAIAKAYYAVDYSTCAYPVCTISTGDITRAYGYKTGSRFLFNLNLSLAKHDLFAYERNVKQADGTYQECYGVQHASDDVALTLETV